MRETPAPRGPARDFTILADGHRRCPRGELGLMRCLGLVPGTHRLEVVARPEPGLPGPGEVLIEMVACGVCGTDRHILAGDWARPAPGERALVLGHEPIGRVLQVGLDVGHLAAGDYVSATNQRSCGGCAACLSGEVDLCLSAPGTGRGINGLDGFLRPRLIDDARFCVRVPGEVADLAVLTEPLAVGEKFIEQARQIQRRVPLSRWTEQADQEDWAAGLRFAIGGAGPIGVLVTLALRCHGAEVHVLDRAPADGAKARLVQALGASYHCSDGADLEHLTSALGHIDCAVEAAGSAQLCTALWRALGRNGIMAVVGGPGGPHAAVHPAMLFGQALGKNQALVGTVASNPRHFRLALEDLVRARARFPAAAAAVISARVDFDHADQAFTEGDQDSIKRVITLQGA